MSEPRRSASGARDLTVAIDASRNRSGGARVHLGALLSAVDPRDYGIAAVHVWSYRALLDALPAAPWLTRHSPAELTGSLPRQLWWQYRLLPAAIRETRCDVLLTTDAGSVCRLRPSVVMSRDMLSFEPGEMQRYRPGFSRLRLELLRHVQVSALRSASGALFLTRYAADLIQSYSGKLPQVRIIPHAVGDAFRWRGASRDWPAAGAPIRCVYVSNADLYKHQWHVVSAIAELRTAGVPVLLRLIGGGSGPAESRLVAAIAEADPTHQFVERLPAVAHAVLPDLLRDADLFIFASSCENMPNTLLEGMAAALPIACSNRGPMPEILDDGGVYFNPEDPRSIASAVRLLVEDPATRTRVVARSREIASSYSWRRTAEQTWSYLADVARITSMRGA